MLHWRGLVFAISALTLVVFVHPAAAETADGFPTKQEYREGARPPMTLELLSSLLDGSDDCTAPTPIASVPYTDTGTTVGKSNTVGTIPLACNGNYTSVAGPDAIYEITVGPGNDLTFSVTTTEPNYDPSIYLLSTCGEGTSCVTGADDCFAANAPGNPCGPISDESFSVNDLAPGTHYFYVDSFYAGAPRAAGPYALEVTGTLGAFPRSIGGIVTGLAGTGLVLQNNGGDDLVIAADGPFTFDTQLDDGDTYDVTVLTDPADPSQTCTVTNGTGTVSGTDVTDIEVDCVTNAFTIGGTVDGLVGTGLVLQNNGGDDLAIDADGPFTFSTPIDDGETYEVTVLTDPTSPSQMCRVANGTGTVAGADVTDIVVECITNAFTVGGTVSGLAGTGLVLQNNGGDDLAVDADGAFTFSTPIVDGETYDVTVSTDPTNPNQTCTVSNGTGTIAGADVTDVEVDCVTDPVAFTIGGVVDGLAGAGLVLQNNGGDDLAINSDGAFTFSTPVDDGDTYDVTVFTQPTGPDQVCTVTNGSGTVSGSDVTDVEVDCAGVVPALGPMGLAVLTLLLALLGALALRTFGGRRIQVG